MSTRLERAARQAAKGKLSPMRHRELVITERNKEILALQQNKRRSDERLRWALCCIELCANGLRNRRGLVLDKEPARSDPEMWNLHAAKLSIEDALNPSNAARDEERK